MDGFTSDSWEAITEMLYGENKLAGTCGQKKARQSRGGGRTTAQQRADQARAQARRGKDMMDPGTRSEAAKKAAQTRAKCGVKAFGRK